ncbi:unnamed protein product [Caenorhabditis auriculariae]|uniref:EB domain-containing protein n=1 Tax=Caenorhabditis auriculariae TaxID=2777116 RepID=A0A8S1H1W5_9PELO|nr:unnamed protein product [Caenorhabditis auriculariae]
MFLRLLLLVAVVLILAEAKNRRQLKSLDACLYTDECPDGYVCDCRGPVDCYFLRRFCYRNGENNIFFGLF